MEEMRRPKGQESVDAGRALQSTLAYNDLISGVEKVDGFEKMQEVIDKVSSAPLGEFDRERVYEAIRLRFEDMARMFGESLGTIEMAHAFLDEFDAIRYPTPDMRRRVMDMAAEYLEGRFTV